MKPIMGYKYQIFSILLLFIVSCNQATKTEINEYLEVKVINIKESESKIGLTLMNAEDSILFANLSENSSKNFEQIKSKLKVDDRLKIKGIIYNFDNSKDATIINIKDLQFLE